MTPEQQQEAVERILGKLEEIRKEIDLLWYWGCVLLAMWWVLR